MDPDFFGSPDVTSKLAISSAQSHKLSITETAYLQHS